MKKPKNNDLEKIIKFFKKNKKQLFFSNFKIAVLLFLSIAFLGLQLFYPYHFIIAISFFMLALFFIVKKILFLRKVLKNNHSFIEYKENIKKEKRKIWIFVILTTMTSAFLSINPLKEKPFFGLNQEQIEKKLEDDIFLAYTSMDFLETSAFELLKDLDSDKQDSNISKKTKEDFEHFLEAVVLSEELTEKHKYFNQIKSKKEREKSFLISYSLYAKKYELLHKIIEKVSKNNYQKKVLNQYSNIYKRKDIYSEMVNNFYDLKTRLRLSSGKIFLKTVSENSEDFRYKVLKEKATGSYKYLFKKFPKTLTYSVENFFDNFKIKMFDLWFPVQKGVANAMGNTIISTRGNHGIISQIEREKMRSELEPGDIMLQRRNWHLTNVGIPGFWTHSAVYTGTMEEMDNYFADIFPQKNYKTFSELMKKEYKQEFEKIVGEDDLGEYAVIEAIANGVIMQSFEKSTDADFVVAFRANISKKEKMQALIKAFKNLGKPYDYNFDFDTRDALVCSELVYDMYFPRKNFSGINFNTSLINGRKIMAPLDIAKKFRREYKNENRELNFVYFLKSNEKNKTSEKGTVEEFMESIDWSKFSFNQIK